MTRIVFPLCARCGHMATLHAPGVKRGHPGKCLVFKSHIRTNPNGVQMVVPGTCECDEYQHEEGEG